MATTNGSPNKINRVLILGDNYAGSSIIKELRRTTLDLHVAHQFGPDKPDDRVKYHTGALSRDWPTLFAHVKPDVVINTVSQVYFDAQKPIIDAAIDTGVARFVPSEFGYDTLNTQIQERLPPYAERAQAIEYLRQLAQDGKIEWVGVATGTVLDRGILSGNLGFDVKWQSAALAGSDKAPWPGSSSAWVGKVMRAVLDRWDEVQNRYIYAAGLIVTAREIIKSLEYHRNKEFAVGKGDVKECVDEARKRMRQGFPDAGMFLMQRSVLYDEQMGGTKPFVQEDAKRSLGLDGEELEEIMKGVMHDYHHHGGQAGCGCD